MPTSERLRDHPHDRLAGPVQVVNLPETARNLRAEAHDAVAGHRQIAVVREGPLTVILFAFETGGHLREHQTDGHVTIHVLVGQLTVTADGTTHTLGSGQLLALAPNVRHGVVASQASEMLLTVHRNQGDAAGNS